MADEPLPKPVQFTPQTPWALAGDEYKARIESHEAATGFMNEESIFAVAIEIESNDARTKYLDDACGEDVEKRTRIDALLQAHENRDSVFEQPALEHKADVEQLNGVPRELGDFKIIGELGRGGMGVVYEAHQKSLNRRVALKVLSSGLGLTAKAVMRFCREAEAAARLHHTNIVPIYSTGEERGVHFYAMELIAGPSLDQVINHLRDENRGSDSTDDRDAHEKPLPKWVDETIAFEGANGQWAKNLDVSSTGSTSSSSTISAGSEYFDQVATMIADVADALEHAHEHGVIHRDIKPSNLLLGPDGRLSINDFGLARMLEQPGMTMTGEFVGSPLYMSPEQITAGRAPLDHRTDIYSLGATLYELVTLQPPFPGTRRDEVIAQVLSKEPKAPRRLNRRVPADLETICLKAIERDPDQRYQTAAALASDLRAYVNRHTISAKRIGPVGRLVKWSRRNPAWAAMVLVVCVATSGIAIQWESNRRSKARAAMALADQQQRNRKSDRDHAQQLTLEYIMQGRLDDAEDMSLSAAQLGASSDWVKRTLAHIKLCRGEHGRAHDLLTQAESLGSSAATDAVRAILYFHSGDEIRYFRALDGLQKSTARSAEDHFYLGLAQIWGNPQCALTELENPESGSRVSPAIRLPRAFANWQCAIDEPDPTRGLEFATNAIKDSRLCLEAWPDNSFASSILVCALLTAAHITRELGDRQAGDSFLSQAKEEAANLSMSKESVDPTLARYHALQQTGQEEEALRFINDSVISTSTGRNYIAAYSLIALFRSGDKQRAASVFKEISESPGNLKQSFYTLVELSANPTPHERERLLETYRAYLAEKSRRGDFTHFEEDWLVLRMLGGRVDESTEIANRSRKFFAAYDSPMQHNLKHVCDYLGGKITETDIFLDRCREENSQRLMANAYFAIAMKALVDGDTRIARLNFEKCTEQGVYQFYVHQWSLAFLDKMADDPKWPSWIERKVVETPTEHRSDNHSNGKAFTP